MLTYTFNEIILKTLCVQKLSSPRFYTLTAPPPPHSTFHSIIKEIFLQPTSTTTFDESLTANVEVSILNNFISYYAGLHRVLLASDDFQLFDLVEKRN
jgi:hypothetical protein